MTLESLHDRPATKEDIGRSIYNEDGKKYTIKAYSPILDAIEAGYITISKDSDVWYWQNPVEVLK